MLDFAHEDRCFPGLLPRAAATPARRGASAALAGADASRADRLARIKAQIADGSYLTDEKLDAALERLITAQCR